MNRSGNTRPTHIREGWRTVTPYLMVADVAAMLRFLHLTFGAAPEKLTYLDDGSLVNATIKLSDSIMAISRATDAFAAMPTTLYVYVSDADTAFKRAIDAGGVALAPIDDKPYGDRNGCIRDPMGNHWWVATFQEEVSSEELAARLRSYFDQKK